MRKPTVKNKYNLNMKDIKSLKIKDRTKISKPLFWRNNIVKAWCISGNTIKNRKDEEYGTYNDFWIGIFDNDKIKVDCSAYGGMANYNFTEFFNYNEIEYEMDLEIQEKLLETVNSLIDDGILEISEVKRIRNEKI